MRVVHRETVHRSFARSADVGRRLGAGSRGCPFVPRCRSEFVRSEHSGHHSNIASKHAFPNRHRDAKSHAQSDPVPDSHRYSRGDAHEHSDAHPHTARAEGHADHHANAIPDQSPKGRIHSADVSARNAVPDARCRDTYALGNADIDARCTDADAPGGTAG
jgi:hypothetical protein